MPIKSFRGLIAHGAQDTLVLHTNNGSIGYRIVKFELMPNQPGVDNMSFVVKIYKIPQSTVDGKVDFSDNTLLGAGYYESEPSSYADESTIIFDGEIFNQDIYITCNETHQPGNEIVNYYIELEQIKLDLSESTAASLKDIRNVYSQIAT